MQNKLNSLIRIFLFIVVLLASIPARALTPPYPYSTYVTGVTFDFAGAKTYSTHGDIWPYTWAADDNVYVASGDSFGFDPAASKCSWIISKMAGPFQQFTNADVYDGPLGSGNGKIVSLLAISNATMNVIYAMDDIQDEPSGNSSNTFLLSSTDMGHTWITNSTDFYYATSFHGHFVQFGKNYSSNTDGYIYLYGSKPKGSGTYLARVLIGSVTDLTQYQYLTSIDTNNQATWGTLANSIAIFHDSNGGGGGADYDAGIGRWIFSGGPRGGGGGSVAMYEGPTMWGPWKTICYLTNWGNLENNTTYSNANNQDEDFSFPQKFMSANGRSIGMYISVYDTPNAVWNDTLLTVGVTLTISNAAGVLDHYVVSAPTTQTAGVPFTITVTAVDSSGIPVTTNTTAITLTNSGSAQFDANNDGAYGDNVQTMTNGVLTVTVKDNVAETVTLTATDSTLHNGSTNVVITPAAFDHLAVSTPSTEAFGQPFNVQVKAQDVFNNTETSDNSTSITISSTLNGAQFDANGDGTFGDNTKSLTAGVLNVAAIDNTPESGTITATGGGKSAVSSLITVGAYSANTYFLNASGLDMNAAVWTNSTHTTPVIPSAGNTYVLPAVANNLPNNGVNPVSYLKGAATNAGTVAGYFLGNSISVGTNTTLRLKTSAILSGAVFTFTNPASAGYPGLILNGGVLEYGDLGSGGPFKVLGAMQAAAGTLSYIDLGAQTFEQIQTSRAFIINSTISGSGNLMVIGGTATNTGTSFITLSNKSASTFSGTWIVESGYLTAAANVASNNPYGQNSSFIVDNQYPTPVSWGIATPLPGARLDLDVPVNSSGTLTVANSGLLALSANCTFSAATIAGTSLPANTYPYATLAGMFPGNMVVGGSGSLTIVGSQSTAPTLNSPVFAGQNLSLTGTGGVPGNSYRILTSTNVTPLSSWTPVATNNFAGDGSFSNSTTINVSEPQRFYRVVSP